MLKKSYYLLKIWEDTEPSLSGPYRSMTTVERLALTHRANDPDMADGLFYLTQTVNAKGKVCLSVDAWSGAFFADVNPSMDSLVGGG